MLKKILPIPSTLTLEQQQILRSNLLYHIMDGSFYSFGMSFIAVQTIFPVFIQLAGGNAVAVGAVPIIWTLAVNFPMMWIAHMFSETSSFKKPMVVYGLVHRFMLLVISLTAFFVIGKISTQFSVLLFLSLLFILAMFGGFGGLPWFQVYTKTVPVKLRGRLLAVRSLIGSLCGAIGGYSVSVIIAALKFPLDFSVLFFCAFIFTMISNYALSKINEVSVNEISFEAPKRFFLFAEAKRILTINKPFRNYLFADGFILMSMTATAFYSVYAIEKFHLPPAYAGTFTVIYMLGGVFSNIIFGYIGDTFGHKINLLILLVCSAGAAMMAILSPNILLYAIVYILVACTYSILLISRMPLVAEMCSESERPMYVGIINTLTAPTVFIGVVYGLIVEAVGYISIFFITIAISLIGFYLLYSNVTEPRKQKIA